MTHEEYRALLGYPDTGKGWRHCSPRLIGQGSCDADPLAGYRVIYEASVAIALNHLHVAILAGAMVIDGCLRNIGRSFVCHECKAKAHLSYLTEAFAEFAKQSTKRLANPAWSQFHTIDHSSPPVERVQSSGIGTLSEMDQKFKNYQLLTEVRQRLQQSQDQDLINDFFKMAGELKLSSRQGQIGDGAGAPSRSPYGGGAGSV